MFTCCVKQTVTDEHVDKQNNSPSGSSSLATPSRSATLKACSKFDRLVWPDTLAISTRSGLQWKRKYQWKLIKIDCFLIYEMFIWGDRVQIYYFGNHHLGWFALLCFRLFQLFHHILYFLKYVGISKELLIEENIFVCRKVLVWGKNS